MATITILGAGELGSCMGRVLSSAGASVHLWDADTAKHPQQQDLSVVVPLADAIFFCIPASAYEPAARSIAPFLREGVPIVSCAKGVDVKKGRFLDQLLTDVFGSQNPFALLSGPMLAEEIDEGKRTSAVLATRDHDLFGTLAPLFRGSLLSVRHSSDVRGVAIAGVVKNVYAILLGACDGSGLGHNARGALLARSIDEMARCIHALGGSRETAYSLAGLGDLDATGSTEYSKNYSVGKGLAQSGVCTSFSEGRASVDIIFRMLSSDSKDFPCMNGVVHMLSCTRQPVDVLKELLISA